MMYQSSKDKLLRDLNDTGVPLERRVWRAVHYCEGHDVTPDGARSLLLEAPADVLAAVEDRWGKLGL